MWETCDNNIDTESHILRCQSAKRHDIREKWIEELLPHTETEVILVDVLYVFLVLL
jgi:hypothetical protein